MNILSNIASFFRRSQPSAYIPGTSYDMRFSGAKYEGALPDFWHKRTVHHAKARRTTESIWLESVQARAITDRLCNLAIGNGMALESVPLFSICAPSMTADQQKQLTDSIEARWNLYAESTEPDTCRISSFGQLEREALRRLFVSGEFFAIIRYYKNGKRQSNMAVQFVESDQICNPADAAQIKSIEARGNKVRDGIEYTTVGEIIAIYVRDDEKTVRIPVENNGRRFLLYGIAVKDDTGVRGVSPLLPVAHELRKITDYQVAEIQSANINASIAAWIKPSEKRRAGKSLSGTIRTEQQPDTSVKAAPQQAKLDRPGIIIQNLQEGEEVVSYNTQRPNSNTNFINDILRDIAAAVGIPLSVLLMVFNNSYSASRGELQLAWETLSVWRDMIKISFSQPFYEQWLTEHIKSGVFSISNFSQSPVLRAAWCRAKRVGRSMPSLNPVADATAAEKRIEAGTTTRERESQQYNGSDFYENVKRLKTENELLREAQFVESNTI